MTTTTMTKAFMTSCVLLALFTTTTDADGAGIRGATPHRRRVPHAANRLRGLTARSTPARCPRRCRCDRLTVDCSYQQLTSWPRGVPTSTTRLDLTGNQLRQLHGRQLGRLTRLEQLDLSGNQLRELPASALRRSRRLKILNLSSNQLSIVEESALSNLRRLREVHLTRNQLQVLPPKLFANLQRVKQIDLSHNQLRSLQVAMFDSLDQLDKLRLHGNSWHCDCDLKNFELRMRTREVHTGYMVCSTPGKYSRLHVRDMRRDLVCGIGVLVWSLVGAACFLVTALFTVVMCRRRTAAELELEAKHKLATKLKRSESSSSIVSLFSHDTTVTSSCGADKHAVTYDDDVFARSDCVVQISPSPLMAKKSSPVVDA